MNHSHYYLVFLVLLSASSSSCEGLISCDQANGYMLPCLSYLTGPTGAKAPPDCCDGAKALVVGTPTLADKRAACVCIKAFALTMPVNYKNAHDLPHNCNVHLPFEITRDLNCDKVGY